MAKCGLFLPSLHSNLVTHTRARARAHTRARDNL